MGSCVSIHRNSESALKLRLSLESKTENLMIPPSPVKENKQLINGNLPIREVSVKSQIPPFPCSTTYVDYGSKDDAFFDSRAWLDSDCEDDFFSVNGDFTPSRGNTPVHHSFSAGANRGNKTHPVDQIPISTPEPSPTAKKKKLSELFKDSFREETELDVHDQTILGEKIGVKLTEPDLPTKSVNDTPYVSGTNSVCGSERTANRDTLSDKEKPIRSVKGCLPGLVSCHNFSERKKKMSPRTSPAVSVK